MTIFGLYFIIFCPFHDNPVSAKSSTKMAFLASFLLFLMTWEWQVKRNMCLISCIYVSPPKKWVQHHHVGLAGFLFYFKLCWITKIINLFLFSKISNGFLNTNKHKTHITIDLCGAHVLLSKGFFLLLLSVR